MKLCIPLAIAGLIIPTYLAQPIHEHHIHKREPAYATVTTVVYVTSGSDASQNAAAAPAASSTAESIVLNASPYLESTSNTFVAQPSSFSTVLYSNTESSTSASSTFTSTSSSVASSTASESSGPVNSAISFAAGGKGITYSPYTNTGACKDAATVKSDLAKLTQFDLIRIYDTDCSSVENVLAAKQPNQKLFAGIYYLDKIAESVSIIQNAVNGNWDEIYTVSVGNELVNSGANTPADIKTAINTARSALTAAGYSGPIVSVDTLVAVQNNPELCDYSDYVAVNSHPFWDGSVAPGDSGSFLTTQIANIKTTCGGKNVLITETGWPTRGQNYGSAVPSISNQQTAVKAIVDAVGDQVFIFTTYNDLWKAPGPYGVEQYWGIFQD